MLFRLVKFLFFRLCGYYVVMADKNNELRRSEILSSTESNQLNRIKEEAMERRGFVKGAVASITGLAVTTETSAAESDGLLTRIQKRKAIRPYRSVEAVKTAFKDHEDLLADIAAETSLSAGQVEALEIDSLGSPKEGSGAGVTYATQEIDDEYVPEIRVMREVEEGKLTVAVVPDINDRYAILNPHDDSDPIVFEDFDTQLGCGGCPENKTCERERYCCGSDCPSCTCYMCERFVCNCYQCGWNCASHCV